jgi:hypothetical protein
MPCAARRESKSLGGRNKAKVGKSVPLLFEIRTFSLPSKTSLFQPSLSTV